MKMRTVACCIAATLAVAAGGCGGDDDNGGGGGDSGGGAPSDTFLQEAKEKLAVYQSEKGTFEQPPASAPDHEPGKYIALISCGESVTFCSSGMQGAADAAKELGWKTTLFDTKGDFATAATGIRQAIARKADGIFSYYIDCKYMRAPLQEAKKAGIPVVAAESYDCNEDSGDAGKPQQLFTWQVEYVEGDYDKWLYEWQMAQLYWPYVKLNGDMDGLFFTDDTGLGAGVEAIAMKDADAKCDCVDTVQFPYLDLYKGIQDLAGRELTKRPDVNAVMVGYESVALSGVASAVQASGRDILLDVAEGLPGGMNLIREGKAEYGAGISIQWEAWSAIDSFVRIFAGEQPVNSGIGLQTFDKDHNMPASGEYEPPADFKSAYKKAWGVSG
jgi:ribose transport system substrate-binding protein